MGFAANNQGVKVQKFEDLLEWSAVARNVDKVTHLNSSETVRLDHGMKIRKRKV